MNNDDLIKSMNLSQLTKEEKAELIRKLTTSTETPAQAARAIQQIHDLLPKTPTEKPDIYEDVFVKEDQFASSSYDRQMMRTFLDERAQEGKQEYAEMHKWWDGTSYDMFQHWFFLENTPEIEIVLYNKDNTKRSFKIKVTYDT